MLLWHHGTVEREWKDSGWVFDGVFYPVEFSGLADGPDRVLGRELLQVDRTRNPTKYPNLKEDNESPRLRPGI